VLGVRRRHHDRRGRIDRRGVRERAVVHRERADGSHGRESIGCIEHVEHIERRDNGSAAASPERHASHCADGVARSHGAAAHASALGEPRARDAASATPGAARAGHSAEAAHARDAIGLSRSARGRPGCDAAASGGADASIRRSPDGTSAAARSSTARTTHDAAWGRTDATGATRVSCVTADAVACIDSGTARAAVWRRDADAHANADQSISRE
jgi:hypothetical protein